MPKPSKAAMKDLPPNWEARNVKGRIVYINHTTRTTQWTKPKVSTKGGSKSQGASAASSPTRLPRAAPVDDFQGPVKAKGASPDRQQPPVRQQQPLVRRQDQQYGSHGGAPRSDSPLPPGWESKVMDGKMVYIDHINKTTTLRKPPSRPPARGAGQTTSGNRELPGSMPSSQRTRSSENLRGTGSGYSYGNGPGNVRRRVHSDANHASNPGLSNHASNPSPSNRGPSSRGPSNHGGASEHSPSAGGSTLRADFDEPLPAGWGRSVTPQGEVYYVNHVTKSTTWSRPRWTYAEEDPNDLDDDESLHEDDAGGGIDGSVRSGRSGRSNRSRGGSSRRYGSNQEDLEPPLPPGWEERMSAEGKVFYINHNDKTTHWNRPDPPLALLPEDKDSLPLEEVSNHDPHVPREEHLGKPLHSDLTDMQVEADHTPFATAESGPHSAVASPATFDDPSAYTHPDSAGNPQAEEVEAGVGAIDLAKDEPVGDAANNDFTDPALEEVADVNPRGISMSSGGGERAPSATVSAPASRATDRGLSGGGSGEDWDASAPARPEQQAQQARAVPHLRSADVLLLEKEMEVAAGKEEATDAAGEGGDGGVGAGTGGPVSSIVKSGLFGSTVRAGGGGSGSNNGSTTGGSGGARSSNIAGAASAGDAAGDAASAVSGGGGGGSVSGGEGGSGSKPPPLGLGWMELKTTDGKVYYQNSILKITQWTRPDPDAEHESEEKTLAAATEAGGEGGRGDEVEAKAAAAAELHTVSYTHTMDATASKTAAEAGWEKVTTPDGRPYYQNMVTIETSWEKPPGWVDPEDDTESEAAAAAVAMDGTDGVATRDVPGGEPSLATSARDSSQAKSAQPAEALEPMEGPLPPGWEKLYTTEGVPFWTNHNERTTSWDPPSLPTSTALPGGELQSARGQGQGQVVPGVSPNSSKCESVDAPAAATPVAAAAVGGSEKRPSLGVDGKPLPEGWEMQTTDQGVVYYVDHINKRTSWDPPLMSTGGQSVIASNLPDIPPAELVPDSADLYMGADLLNRFFSSWRGDTMGKSPLEAARNVIVTYLTGPGLKATKGRNGSCLQRFLYLSPTNKQIVWATRATSKGKMSKKGLSLHTVTELHYEKSSIRVEARGESASLTFKSTAVDTLTSEGATILLGVLLADMTGTMLQLEGVSGGGGSNYYPAAFVNDVLRVRQARRDNGTSAAVAVVSPQGSQSAQPVEEVPVLVADPVEEDAAEYSPQQQQQQQPAASNGVSAAPTVQTRYGEEPRKKAAASELSSAAASTATATVVSPSAAPSRTVDSKPAAVTARGVGASYMARIRNGSNDWQNKNGGGGSEDKTATTAASTAAAPASETRRSPGSAPVATSIVETTMSQKPEIAMSGEDEDEDLVAAGVQTGGLTSGSYPKVPEKSTPTTSLIADSRAVPAGGAGTQATAAAPGAGGVGKAEVGASAEAAVGEGGGEEEEDEETREYRRVLVEMLRPAKLEKYVDDFLRSEVTLDILPLVERKDLESEVGITAPIAQLKIMKQIKKKFPQGF